MSRPEYNISAEEIEALKEGGMEEDIDTTNKAIGRRLQHRHLKWTAIPPLTTPVKVMLIGEDGAGKSTLGNVLLGHSSFSVDAMSEPENQTCQEATGTYSYGEEKLKITVVDTSMKTVYGTIDVETPRAWAEVINKMEDKVDVFILVLNSSRVRSGDLGIKRLYAEKVINPEFEKRFMVVTTHSQAHYQSTGVEGFLDDVRTDPDVNKFFTAIKNRVVMVELGTGPFSAATVVDEKAAYEKEITQARDMVMAMVMDMVRDMLYKVKEENSKGRCALS